MKGIINKVSTQKAARFFTICGVSFLSLSVTGCNLYEEGHITPKRAVVEQENVEQNVALSDVDDGFIDALARDFYKYGGSSLNVQVTYDPHSRTNTAMMASENAADIAQRLRSAGVKTVRAGVLPVNGQGSDSRLLISYTSYSASGPEGCAAMPGMDGRSLEYNPDYQLGCGVQTLMAKQVARPKDLMGHENTDIKTDGRPAANVVDAYRLGAPNKPLDGEKASK